MSNNDDAKKDLRTPSSRGLDDIIGDKSDAPVIPDKDASDYTNSSVRVPYELIDRIDWTLKKAHRKHGHKQSRTTLVRVLLYAFDQLSDAKKDRLLASEDDTEMLQRFLEYVDTE